MAARSEDSATAGRPPDLAQRFEDNLAEHASCLHRGTPGMTVRRDRGLLIADSGLDDDSFNFIGAARLTTADAPARIRQVIAEAEATGRQFAWRVGPASAPSDLSALLAAAGLAPAGTDPAMWALLGGPGLPPGAGVSGSEPVGGASVGAVPAGPALPAPAIAGLEIRQVSTRAELSDWAWVLAANWDPPAPTVLEFYRRAAQRVLAAGCPARLLTGYYDGRPACTAEVLLRAGTAGLYNVATLASHRRRGLGGAISAAALQTARQAGAHVAVLSASELGVAVYGKLGFRAFAAVTEHALPR
jgi:GNAT superfamily N-acetyltransferase